MAISANCYYDTWIENINRYNESCLTLMEITAKLEGKNQFLGNPVIEKLWFEADKIIIEKSEK